MEIFVGMMRRPIRVQGIPHIPLIQQCAGAVQLFSVSCESGADCRRLIVPPGERADGEAKPLKVAAREELDPVMIILVGPPGCGKSTFSKAMEERVEGRWQRINQASMALPLPSLGCVTCAESHANWP
jgi:hypothetical protein